MQRANPAPALFPGWDRADVWARRIRAWRRILDWNRADFYPVIYKLGQEGIRINTVSPGWVFTERQISEYFAGPEAAKHYATMEQYQALQLKIQPEDIANHVLFYLSTVICASTGHNCVVAAGWILE